MKRNKNSIPLFVQSFKESFFSYTLNLSQEESTKLLHDECELNETQNKVLDEIIQTCRTLRIQGIDQNDPDFSIYFRLRETLVNNQHVLNHWRVNCGGTLPVISEEDELMGMFKTLGVEAYPAFFLKERNMGHFLRGISLSHQHPIGKILLELILKDDKLKELFNNIGASPMETYCSYVTSTGRGGSVQLAIFIDLVLVNSYYLMILSGGNSITDYLKKLELYINLLRDIAINKKTIVPVYFGYSNISFPENSTLEIPQGQLKSFDSNLLEILPQNARPSSADGVMSSFIFKGTYLYTFEFQNEGDKHKWPKELDENWDKLDRIDEDLKLSVNLACKRTPPLSLNRQWTMIFDPLSHGINLSWSSDRKNPTPYYNCSSEETLSIVKWCKTIHETDDSIMRLAIRKLISAISQRTNAIDGFIDGIVVWENLFGANAELSFRISSAISCLLEKDKTKRKELFKKLKEAYDTRSTIVHGVKEINYDRASELRDFAIEIGLKCLELLYKEHPELIDCKDRSLTILLEHE